MGMKYNSVPRWLEALLEEKFFSSCSTHLSFKKNEKKVFCLDCCASFCAHCLPLHRRHTLVQIRRYVYRDVLRLCDAQKLMNCSSVQPYTTNSEKVVFLHERPISKPFRGSGKLCNNCDRSLQPPFFFCSLSCKVHCLITSENGIQHDLHGCDFSPSSTRKCGSQNFSDSDFDSPGSPSSSTSSDPSGSAAVPARLSCRDLSLFAVSEFTKKKRSYGNPTARLSGKQRRSPEAGIGVAINRRKGVPQRSPFS